MHSPTPAAGARIVPLLRQIEKLPAPEGNLLRLKALFGWASGKSDFLAVANRAFPGPEGLAWTHKTLNAALERLVSLRLLNVDFSCVEVLWHPLTVEFLATPAGRTAAAAMASLPAANDRGPYYSYILQTDKSFLRRLRLIKLLKKARSRRKIFFEGMHGLFFLLALIRANDPTLFPEAQTHIEALDDSIFSPGFAAIRILLWLLQGLESKARASLQMLRKAGRFDPLQSACVTLAVFLLDGSLDQAEIKESEARFAALRETLPLIARIHAEVLAKTAANPEPYRDFLREFPGQGQFAEQGQVIAFTEIVHLRQPWERTFDSLANLLMASAPRAASTEVKKSRRLVWLLDPETKYIEVVEQAVKGHGWTLGRSIAMKRLYEQDPRLDYLSDHDRRALRTIAKSTVGWYGGETFSFDLARTLPALIGHPLVFHMNQRDQPLELIAYPVELAVTEQKGGYKFALTHRADQPTVFLEAETPSRWRVVEFSARLLAVQEVLGEKGLLVPRSGRERVLALVKEQVSTLPIRAEIAEVDLPALDGRPEPVLQMAPLDEGLKAAMVVRPFGPAGPYYLPGLGAAFALAVVEGVGLRVKRDLDAERAAAAKALAALPALRKEAASGHEWVIADAESALELLLQVSACQPPLTVEWPEGKKWVARAEVSTASLSLKLGRARDWFQIEGKVQVDDDLVLDMQDLLSRLDQAQGRFVPLADGSFLALTRRFQQQLARLRGISEKHAKGLRLPVLGALAMQDLTDEAGAVKADKEWKAFVARLAAADGRHPEPPTTLQAELRDYQLEGFQWLSRLSYWRAGACLADDMGLGKTVQAIAVMLEQAPQGPCLVIAPTSVCHNWEKELSRFAPSLAVHKLGAAGGRAEIIGGLKAMDVLVISYGLLHQEADRLADIDWRMVVFDEAQAIKNADTRRAQAGQRLKANFRLALTGTPIENYLDELWSLFNIVNPGLLGSRENFSRRFATPIERNRDTGALQALRALIRPFILRRTKSTVLAELPPRTEVTLEIDLPEEERAFYEAMRRRALEALAQLSEGGGKPGQSRIHILAEITKLRRACCHPSLVDPQTVLPGAKLEALLELVDDLIRNRHKALVFSQFVGQLEKVSQALRARNIGFQYLDGSTPAAERAERVAAFQAGEGDLFLISLKAGGVGLNLTAADYVIHLDPWWNPAVEDQASDRAHRIGQSRPVTIYRLIARDSIEERILDLHRAKRDLAGDLLEGAEMSARLTDEDLLDLIRG